MKINRSEIIEIKYLAPTDKKGARIKVKSEYGASYTVPYDYEHSHEGEVRKYFTNQGYDENCPLHRIEQKDHYIFFVLWTHYEGKCKWFDLEAKK